MKFLVFKVPPQVLVLLAVMSIERCIFSCIILYYILCSVLIISVYVIPHDDCWMGSLIIIFGWGIHVGETSPSYTAFIFPNDLL